jgi:predicted nucleotidyltransferase component of viral defense system
MRNIFKISEDEKKELFRETSREMGIPEAIIEKDYWVCRTLDYLFHRSPWKKNLAFKGGTSLSKAYSLIERFSEDIDLILDYRILGYSKDEFKKERTQTKQGAFNH